MTKKILYIEDIEENRLLVRRVLEEAGYAVVEAVDGLSGIQTAQEERPDLILIDVGLSGLDGYEVVNRIRVLPEQKDIPILATRVIGQPTSRSDDFFRKSGFDGFILKPIDVRDLREKVAEFLEDKQDITKLEEENAYLRKYCNLLANRLEHKIQELTEANEALAHTDTMKSRFISLTAHELRTPLAAVHGYLSVLTSPGGKFLANADENTVELIDGIVTGIERLQGLVQDMLDVTRIEAGALQLKHAPIHLSLIFKKIQKDFKNVVARRQQTLTIGDASHVPVMWIDGERVTQILRNLVSNAVKYTPDGGAIEITADTMASDDQKNTFVKITISDSGVGVPKDQHEHIFESLYEVRDIELHSTSKTDFMGGGVGLGLPIARGVAETHGGSLWVESEGYDPERCPGSKFHLILPLGKPPKH